MPQTHPHIYTQPYVVIGAFIVRDGKVLLVQENHLPDKGKWNIPAGKLDYGENPTEAVVREVFEETGLDFKPTSILGFHSIHRKDIAKHEANDTGTIHVLRIVYLGEFEGELTNKHGETEDNEMEISDYKWAVLDDVLNMENSLIRYHDLKDYVRDYMTNKSYPLDILTHIVQE